LVDNEVRSLIVTLRWMVSCSQMAWPGKTPQAHERARRREPQRGKGSRSRKGVVGRGDWGDDRWSLLGLRDRALDLRGPMPMDAGWIDQGRKRVLAGRRLVLAPRGLLCCWQSVMISGRKKRGEEVAGRITAAKLLGQVARLNRWQGRKWPGAGG